MVTGTLLAAAVLGGVPWQLVVLMTIGVVRPAYGAVVLLVLVLSPAMQRRRAAPPGSDEARYHAAAAAELRSGASLRLALAEASMRVPELALYDVARRIRTGVPVGAIAPEMARRMSTTGSLVGPALVVAGEAGGSAAHVFDRLAVRAADEGAAHRERHIATAQARLSAWVVGGLPLVAVAFAASTGRIAALLRVGTVGAVVLAVGLGLLAAGLAAVVFVVRAGGR
jgi:Flp pilus assembly protein TadB